MWYGDLISTNVDRKPEVALLSCEDEVSEGMKWACRLGKVEFVLASDAAAFPIELNASKESRTGIPRDLYDGREDSSLRRFLMDVGFNMNLH